MGQKDFKTIDEQVEILRSRGLTIEDEEKAKAFLFYNNYYRVSGYSLTLRNNDVFNKSATFQNIMDIYHFDHEFRHILLQYIEMIEVKFKSVYAYEFTRKYGPIGYLDKAHFTDSLLYQETMNKANEQKNKRLSHEAYLKHFIKELHEDIPLWAFIDLLTIADISKLYKVSEKPVKNAVAQAFGLVMKKNTQILGQYIHSMTIIRNLCAHGGRLYNRLFQQKPSLNKSERAMLIRKDGNVDNAHLYGFILIMRRLLNPEDFAAMKNAIVALTLKYPFVRMDYYGFRGDWMQNL